MSALVSTDMNESELIDEVLELTLACQRGIATPEELARLERLLSDNPRAVLWYLRIVDDTLTLPDAAAGRETTTISPPGVHEAAMEDIASPATSSKMNSLLARLPRLSLAIGAVLCTLIAGFWLFTSVPSSSSVP